jgi:hypothetical protein
MSNPDREDGMPAMEEDKLTICIFIMQDGEIVQVRAILWHAIARSIPPVSSNIFPLMNVPFHALP